MYNVSQSILLRLAIRLFIAPVFFSQVDSLQFQRSRIMRLQQEIEKCRAEEGRSHDLLRFE